MHTEGQVVGVRSCLVEAYALQDIARGVGINVAAETAFREMLAEDFLAVALGVDIHYVVEEGVAEFILVFLARGVGIAVDGNVKDVSAAGEGVGQVLVFALGILVYGSHFCCQGIL